MKTYYKHQSNPSSYLLAHTSSLVSLPFRLLFALSSKLFTLTSYLIPHKIMRRLSSTQRLFVNMIIVSVILIFGVFIYTSFINPEQTKAAWFNTSWAYRLTVPVTNTGSELINVQIPIATDTASLVTAGKMRSDCRDIRVTTQTGKVLSLWIHQCNTATTRIYVLVNKIPAGSSNLYLYYGNSAASQNTEVKTGTSQFPGISCKTILDHSDSTGDGTYTIDPNAGSPSDAFTAYCDMTTDGGGWTIVNSSNGTINQQPLTSNTEVSGNPFSNASSNIANSKKESISTVSAESLFKRSTGVWLKANVPLFDGNLTAANQHPHNTSVTLTANDGTTTSTAVAGYSNYNNASGGDYGITTSVGFDHHSTGYYHLRGGCGSMYLYRYGTTYNVNTALGSWALTHACVNNGTQMGPWYAAMRGTNTPLIANISISSPTNEEQSDGPLGNWRFDEGQGQVANDSSSNKNDITLGATSGSESSDPTWSPSSECISGKCLFFDGTDDYAQRSARVIPTGPYTVSVWAKPTLIDATARMVYWQGETQLYMSTSGILSRLWNGTTAYSANYSTTLTASTWYHLEFVYTGSQVLLYVNGNLVAGPTAASGNAYTGAFQIGKDESTNYFKGYIDSVKVYPYARTSDQVKLDFNSRGSVAGAAISAGKKDSSPLSNGLVGYWKMDESSANTCSGGVNDSCDSSGNGNDAAWAGNATASTSGRFGTATSYDGNGDYGQVAASTSLQITDEVTVCSWVNTWMTSMSGGIFEKTSNGSVNTGYLLFSYSGNYYWRITNGSLQTVNSTSTLTSLKGKWAHVCGTYSKKAGGNLRIYINGALEASSNVTGSTTINSGSGVSYIGSLAGTYNYNGAIDEVRVYNRALSPVEVSQLYSFAPGPVAYYDFEEKGGTTLYDRSGTGNNSTSIAGSPTWTKGVYGSGLQFDNDSTDQVVIPASSSLYYNDYTLGFWIKFDSTYDASYRQILTRDPTGTDRAPGLWRAPSALRLHWKQYPGNFGPTSAGPGGENTSFTAGQWYYLSGVKNGANFDLYINGVKIGTSYSLTDPITNDTGGYFYIGKSGGYTSAGFTIDDLKLYNYARTPGQIISDMNASHPIGGSPIGSQYGYWKMDEGYGSTIKNSGSQTSLIGTLTPGASGSNTTSAAMWTQEGKFNRGIELDGTDDFVDFGLHSIGPVINGATEITVSSWIKLASLPTAGNTFQLFAATNSTGGSVDIKVNETGTISPGGRSTAGDGFQSITSNTALTTNRWYYVAAVYDYANDLIKVYVDGKLDKSSSVTFGATSYTDSANATLNDSLGNFEGQSRYFKGIIDNFKIYGTGLTSSEILIDYNQNSSLSLGTLGTSSDGKTASSSASTAYCIPGDTSTCAAPVGEWNFEEGSGMTVNDTSGNGNTGTWNGTGATHWTQGKIGKGGNFNGSNDYVSITDSTNSVLDVTSEITTGGWVRFNAIPTKAYEGILSKDNAYLLIMNSAGNGFVSYLYNGTTWIQGQDTGNLNLQPNTWYYIAMTYTSGVYKIYKNGVVVSTDTDSLTISTNDNPVRIGTDRLLANRYFNGSIDQVTLYNYARTPAQIAYAYNRGAPIARYKLDECQGSTLHDAAGNGNDGTITIGASGTQTSVGTCNTASTAWGNGATGKFNSSLNFDGNDDYVSVTDPGSSSILDITGSFSLSAWVKLNSSWSATGGVISKRVQSTTTTNYSLFVTNTRVLDYWNGSTNTASTHAISTNTWHHIVVTNDGSTTRYYIDGILDNSASQTIGAANDGPLFVGAAYSGFQHFFGQIDDVQVFNYALTNAQVKTLMNQGGAVRFGP